MLFNKPEFEFIYLDDHYEITKYNGNDRVVFIPETYQNHPVQGLFLDAFKHDTKRVVILNHQLLDIHPFEYDMETPIVLYTYNHYGLKQKNIKDTYIRPDLEEVFSDGDVIYAKLMDNIINVIGHQILQNRMSRFGRFGETITIKNKVKGSDVRRIEAYAFYEAFNIKAIELPKDLTYIGDYAFYGVEMLEEIEVPSMTRFIGKYAFANCLNLRSILLLSESLDIDDHAFKDTNRAMIFTTMGQEFLDIQADFNPDLLPFETGYEKTDDYEGLLLHFFKNKTAVIWNHQYHELTDVTIPEFIDGYQVIAIAPFTFYGNRFLRHVVLPNSIEEIYQSAFGNTNIHSIVLPNQLIAIRDAVFYGCLYLESIIIPNTVKIIMSNAFYQCSLLSQVTLPNQLEIILEDAFTNCVNLKDIEFPESLVEIGQAVFLGTDLREIVIPKSVEIIRKGAFLGLDHLQSFKIKNKEIVLEDMTDFDQEKIEYI